MRQIVNLFLCLLFLLGLLNPTGAQTREGLTVQVGSKSITTSEYLVIYFTLPVSDQPPVYQFPEIANFKKLGVSRSKSSLFQNGQVVQTQTFSQYYQPNGTGSFTIPSLEVQVNGQMIPWDSFTVQVTEGTADESKESEELVIPEGTLTNTNGAFFLVSTNLRTPFVGQEFTLKNVILCSWK